MKITFSVRARVVALALGLGAGGLLVAAPASMAAAPTAGANCQAQDGKISGRGSSLQTWLQYGLIGQYDSDVCGKVAADTSANGGDPTHPGSAIDTLSGGTTFAQDWMLAYNYPSAQDHSATGSGAGQTAIACRAESFSGTDIPATASQLSTINGAVPATGATVLGKPCDPSGLVAPFPPAAGWPNTGDATSTAMVIPVGISAVETFANLPTTCATGSVSLTNADVQGLWGGSFTNWNQVSALSGNANCNVPITRVVRQDNSGTTQGFDNYLADALGYSTQTCAPSSTTAGTFGEMQGNQATNGTDVNWPTGTGCSTLTNGANSGGPTLIATAEGINGAVGYADYSDTIHDTNNFQSSVSGNNIVTFGLTASDGTPGVSAVTPAGGSNCTSTATLPSGGNNGAVGLGGTWNLTAQTSPNGSKDDIAYAKEGSTYPACSLTWDFVWTHEDGNSTTGPESQLTADQRRTEYSYFTYLFSDAAQSSEAADGYAALPSSWLTTLRKGFQANY